VKTSKAAQVAFFIPLTGIHNNPLNMKGKKHEHPEKINEPSAIDVFITMCPGIFTFLKSLYDKRKSELKAKLDNRPSKEEKETLLTDERKKITNDLESHPLFAVYHLLSKPYSEGKAFAENSLAGIPQTMNVASSDSDLKAQEIMQSIIDNHLQPDSNIDIFDFGLILKKLADIPEVGKLFEDIPNNKSPFTAFAYHLISMEGDNRYIKHIIRTYEGLQTHEIKPTEPKKEFEKSHRPNTEKETGDIESLIQTNVRHILSEKGIEANGLVNDILSIEQACQYLKLAKQTIYGFTSKNEIPFFKKGKKLYFKKTELEQWLLEGRQKTHREIRADAINFINNRKKR
jgi:excisionase family DNA binding protein